MRWNGVPLLSDWAIFCQKKQSLLYLLCLFKQLMRLYVKNGYIVCIVCKYVFCTALYVYKMNIWLNIWLKSTEPVPGFRSKSSIVGVSTSDGVPYCGSRIWEHSYHSCFKAEMCEDYHSIFDICQERKTRAVACPIRRESLFTKNLTTHRPAPNTFLKGLVQEKISERNGTSVSDWFTGVPAGLVQPTLQQKLPTFIFRPPVNQCEIGSKKIHGFTCETPFWVCARCCCFDQQEEARQGHWVSSAPVWTVHGMFINGQWWSVTTTATSRNSLSWSSFPRGIKCQLPSKWKLGF